jgi:lipopolysaccharide transport system ATP-binding protein
MSVLSVRGVGKAFREYSSEWKRVGRWVGLGFKPVQEKWAVREVTFALGVGEAVGLVGQNGAGKSTLLKLITGTLRPTEGSVSVQGRVAAILELGMGFNPELTGRQNVFHAAGLMGFSERQIASVIHEIEAFAELGSYFNEPLRTYSSGMQMRVAFAVATAFRPDVLIVDEALSVGDAYFQHKSFGRIRMFREQGTSLLCVSHDPSTIKSICDRALLMENGQLIKDGAPEEVMDFYNATIADKSHQTIAVRHMENGRSQTSSGTGEARVTSIVLCDGAGEAVDFVGVGDLVELRIAVAVSQPLPSLVLGYGIKDRLGQVMFGTNTWHTDQVLAQVDAGERYEFRIAFQANLGVGTYSIQTALVDRDTHLTANYEWRDLALVFHVINRDKQHFTGCMWSQPQISIRRCDS